MRKRHTVHNIKRFMFTAFSDEHTTNTFRLHSHAVAIITYTSMTENSQPEYRFYRIQCTHAAFEESISPTHKIDDDAETGGDFYCISYSTITPL